MSNGIIDIYRFTKLENKLIQLRTLWNKYEYQEAILHIDQHISIERDFKKDRMFVLVNGQRVIEQRFGFIEVLGGSAITGVTLGRLNCAPTHFLTKDTIIANQSFIQKITNLLDNTMLQNEVKMKDASKKRWGIK